MDSSLARRLQTLITNWVLDAEDLRALALCGSWARGEARPDSDLDLLVLARPTALYTRTQAVETIPFADARFQVASVRWATYGVVHSAHIALTPEAEVELTFAAENWAATNPIDAGTRRVVQDGFVVLVDKDQALASLAAAIGR